MNNKTYANYLMHGRTKGSRNGISTTKGYTAVGQKAKGKLINGKYVYDAGASNNWQQQAALERWKKQNQNAIAAKKKKAEAFDKASDAYRLGLSYPVDQMANRTRTVNEHYNKNWKNNTTINYDAPGSGSYLDAKKAKNTAYLKGRNAVNKATMNGTNANASQSADLARWKQQNRNNIAASKKAAKQQELIKKADASYAANQGKANNWQAQGNMVRDADRSKKARAEYNKMLEKATKPSPVNWQDVANQHRAANEAFTKAGTGKTKTADITGMNDNARMEATQRYIDNANATIKKYNEKRSKNAMQNDPRYTSNKPGPLFTSRDPKYGYSGKNDSRAPVFKEITMIDMYGNKTGGKETKMDRDPYFESWSKATNKQETAKAQAGNKAFMNAFEESKKRNSRSDIGNALADAKEDAKNAFKALKKKLKKKK